MAPFHVIIRAAASNTFNSPLPDTFSSPLPDSSQALSSSTGVNDPIINIIFGILACIIGVVTVWQAHRAWHIWHMSHNSSRPRQILHDQTTNNVLPPPYSETPDSIADGPRTLPRAADETTATRSQPPEGLTTSVSSERSGIQPAGADPIPMDVLRSVSTNVEDVEHAHGV